MNKQTAVEYLYEFLPTIIQKDLKNKFDKAKEMERQQIIDAATWGGLAENGIVNNTIIG